MLRKKCDAFYGQVDAIVGRSRYRGEKGAGFAAEKSTTTLPLFLTLSDFKNEINQDQKRGKTDYKQNSAKINKT